MFLQAATMFETVLFTFVFDRGCNMISFLKIVISNMVFVFDYAVFFLSLMHCAVARDAHTPDATGAGMTPANTRDIAEVFPAKS